MSADDGGKAIRAYFEARGSSTEGAYLSGGVIGTVVERGQWAKLPFAGKLAHLWRPARTGSVAGLVGPGGRGRAYEAVCKLASGIADARTPALHPGTWPRCKVCNRIRQRGLA